MPPLTEAKVRAIRVSGKVEKYADGYGLYIELTKAGSKIWRYKYRFEGKEKRLSFGSWPEVSIKEARDKRDDARRLLRDRQDPARAKKIQEIAERTFEEVSREWVDRMRHTWSQRHTETVVDRLIANVYPFIGGRTILEISPVDVLELIRRIENRGAHEVAHRVLGICSQIFRYAVASGLVLSDPCRDLKGTLTPRLKGRFAAIITPEDAGELMVRIEDYQGTAVVRSALAFSALTFCRPGEIRHAEWSGIDFDEKMWRIPATKMKLTKAMKMLKEPHIVPLSTQAVQVLQRIQHFTGGYSYIFPNPRNKTLPASENAVNVAIRKMGYTKEQMTAHGFRSMASTLLNELGFRSDIIEAQLAHVSADKIRAIYNRAQYLEERRDMMQKWGDYLDELKRKAKIKREKINA